MQKERFNARGSTALALGVYALRALWGLDFKAQGSGSLNPS